jgi:hypothetical protein
MHGVRLAHLLVLAGEDVQVLGGPGREVLSNESRTAREQEPVAGRQAEDSCATWIWNGVNPSGAVMPTR